MDATNLLQQADAIPWYWYVILVLVVLMLVVWWLFWQIRQMERKARSGEPLIPETGGRAAELTRGDDLQRVDTSVDQPLFSVVFRDRENGWAVGLWSLVVATRDGGKTWTPLRLPPPPGGKKADRNLLKIFANRMGTLGPAETPEPCCKGSTGCPG